MYVIAIVLPIWPIREALWIATGLLENEDTLKKKKKKEEKDGKMWILLSCQRFVFYLFLKEKFQ